MVISCVIRGFLVTDFNKVWRGEGEKVLSKAFGRLLCSRPKAKRSEWERRKGTVKVQNEKLKTILDSVLCHGKQSSPAHLWHRQQEYVRGSWLRSYISVKLIHPMVRFFIFVNPASKASTSRPLKTGWDDWPIAKITASKLVLKHMACCLSRNDAIVSKKLTDAAVFHPSYWTTNGALPITFSLITIPQGSCPSSDKVLQ
jgi:hypothetical protein